MNTLEMLKAYAQGVSAGAVEKLPPETVCSVMLANNRLLAAAIIESGGELVISPASVHEMLTTGTHVVAMANEDGSVRITLAPKDEILSKPESMAL